MSRYIDADALKRKAQKVGTEVWKMKLTAPIETTLNQFIDWINEAPSIDIVRCKECKHRGTDDCPMCNECGRNAHPTSTDDFCSHGEREGE